ncbi:hypothetical protein CEUSTIGMA_g6603.t1 [Chlamydomonas eustigma]|uniref:Uncharacterized protein n=1 Tax=Chlamydomonas eustigma TaxID=1157962 RepID=A0A250X7W2_9CHLO|nr:hypothetical protein CEUSTIGMA_g6603.t1 [Chlamydomonas eustigma]|eukprot:GAX79163.1 hypothetical protein CEUSTIGMA_g6603.t1 [Chlamydomonas eustigma]
MFNRIRNRLVDKSNNARLQDIARPDKPIEDFSEPASSRVHMPSVLLLSFLLLSTLFLLRYDNSQLSLAEHAIRDLKKTTNDMKNRMLDLNNEEIHAIAEDVLRNEAETLRKKAEGLQKQILDMEKELAAARADVAVQSRERRILARRLGMKTAGSIQQ